MLKQTLAICSLTLLIPFALKTSVQPAVPGSSFDGDPRTPIFELPFVIEEPGSYYVAAALFGASEEDGITIEANHVNLDLNGFTITGEGGEFGTAIKVNASWVTISNGHIQGWAEGGITAVGARHRVEEMQLDGLLRETGIVVGDESIVANCSSIGSRKTAIYAGANARISNCYGASEHPTKIYAIEVGPDSTLSDCISDGGFLVGAGSTLRRCRTDAPETGGITTGERCKIEDCFSSEGIYVGPESIIVDCTASGWEQKDGDAIRAGMGTHISRSRISGPVDLEDRCVMTDCRVTSLTQGVSVSSDCVLEGNQLSQIGYPDSPEVAVDDRPALVVWGDRNRLERNAINVTHANEVFRITGIKNVFVKNSVSGGPYTILPGNAYGPFAVIEGGGDLSLAPRHHLANYVN